MQPAIQCHFRGFCLVNSCKEICILDLFHRHLLQLECKPDLCWFLFWGRPWWCFSLQLQDSIYSGLVPQQIILLYFWSYSWFLSSFTCLCECVQDIHGFIMFCWNFFSISPYFHDWLQSAVMQLKFSFTYFLFLPSILPHLTFLLYFFHCVFKQTLDQVQNVDSVVIKGYHLCLEFLW